MRYQRIASKIFSMLKLLLQVIASNLNVNRKSIASQLLETSVQGLIWNLEEVRNLSFPCQSLILHVNFPGF